MASLQLVETEGGRGERLDRQHRAALQVLRNLSAVLPPMDTGMVDTLAESMLLQGYFPEEPIVRYQVPAGENVTIIGRHREAAAAKAGIEPVAIQFSGDPVEAVYRLMASVLKHRYLDMEQRLAVKRALDAAGYDWEQITRDRGLRVTRQQIEAELMAQSETDKPLNHRAIARKLNMDFSRLRVDRACKALVGNGSLNHCPHRFTEDGHEARGAKPQPPAPPAPQPPAPAPEPPASGTKTPGEAGVVSLDDRVHPDPMPAPVIQPRPADEETVALDTEIRYRLLNGKPTDFRALAQQFGFGTSRVQNRIQWNMGYLAARADHPACSHSCPVHCVVD